MNGRPEEGTGLGCTYEQSPNLLCGGSPTIRVMEVGQTTGFTGQNPTKPPCVLWLCCPPPPRPRLCSRSPISQSLSLSLSSALEGSAQEILPVSWFQRSPSFSEAQLLVWCVAHKPLALGQPRACFSPWPLDWRGLCLTLWSHHLRGFYNSGGGLFFSREVEQVAPGVASSSRANPDPASTLPVSSAPQDSYFSHWSHGFAAR